MCCAAAASDTAADAQAATGGLPGSFSDGTDPMKVCHEAMVQRRTDTSARIGIQAVEHQGRLQLSKRRRVALLPGAPPGVAKHALDTGQRAS